MNTALEYILITLASLAATLLVRLIISLLFRYARVYITIGTRLLTGYLIPDRHSDDYIFYSGLVPLLRKRKGVVVKEADIRLFRQNEDYDQAEMPAGNFDKKQGIVNDEFGTEVANIENAKCRACRAVYGDVELAYSKSSIRSKGELSPFGAAVGALLHKKTEEVKRTPDIRVGVGDLFLPAAYIYMVLYYPLVLLLSSFGEWQFPLLMVGAYLVILLIMYIIKHSVIMSNGSFKWTSLFGDNIGMGFINWTLIIVTAIMCSMALNSKDIPIELMPGLCVTLFAVAANMTVFPRFRHIESPYTGWTGPWRKPSFKPSPNKSADLQDVTFSWVEILGKKGIKGDDRKDTLTLRIPRLDFEGSSPRVRGQNLFFTPGLHSEEDRDLYTHRVLEGADKALTDSGDTDVYEQKLLTQIVNSAYQICTRYNLADFEMFDLILMFCQMNIKYIVDEESTAINKIEEYYRFACETLFDREGDCDCKAVLGYKLFELLGVKPQFVLAKTNGSENYNHAALVLRNDPDASIQLPPSYKEYAAGKGVYCEATSDGNFHPGDLPQNLDTDSLRVIGN